MPITNPPQVTNLPHTNYQWMRTPPITLRDKA